MKKRELAELLGRERVKNALIIRELTGLYEQIYDCDGILPGVHDIIFDGRLTAIVWDDGTDTRTHLADGDTYDPLFGVIACIVRKLTNNRGHSVNDNEPLINEMARDIQSMDDIDTMTDYCLFTLDILSVLQCSSNIWLKHLGDGIESDAEDKQPSSCSNTSTDEKLTWLSDKVDLMNEEIRLSEEIRRREEVRQKIRDLLDAGEL